MTQQAIFNRLMVRQYDNGKGEIALPDGRTINMCADGRAMIHHNKQISQLPIREGDDEIGRKWGALKPYFKGVDGFDVGLKSAEFLERDNKKHILGDSGRFAQLVTRRETYTLWFLYAGSAKRYFLYDKRLRGVICDSTTLPYVTELLNANPCYADSFTQGESILVLKRFIETTPIDLVVKELLEYIKWK